MMIKRVLCRVASSLVLPLVAAILPGSAVMLIAGTAEDPDVSSALFDPQPVIKYEALVKGFSNVPDHAKMRVWWFWHAGQATRQSITQDLEAMKANGITGALVADNGSDKSPQGPVFMSEEWKVLWAHVIRESSRLGIEISFNIQSGCGDPGNPDIASDNGLKVIVFSKMEVEGPAEVEKQLPMPRASNIFYQDIAVQAVKSTGAVDADAVVDLTSRFKNGVLTWMVPEGKWAIIRYGMTSTGKRNAYASKGYRGGLCYDPINKSGVTAHFGDVVTPLVAIAKQNGNSLKYIHVDSWEMGSCNWTQGFEDAFKQRRGYDMRPYLPVLAGQTVESREISDRFMEDYNLTVADLAVEENYEVLKELAREEGVFMHSESAGPHKPPVDGLRALGVNDIPMGEAWARSKTHRVTEPNRMQVALAVSAAHIYGKRFAAAEAPTSVGPDWERSPNEVKNVLDQIFCTGINRLNWHTYDSSPDEFGIPGVAYFAGTHLNRKVTWWNESKAFIDYINRTQHMLSQGLHVADVLGCLGSRAPLFAILHRLERNDIPAGYAWDMCNADAFLKRASVKDGRIVMPDGKSYALFALSKDGQMFLPLLLKIEKMVADGMVLAGNPPKRPFGLTGYPESDQEFNAIVKRLWGDADGADPVVREYGRGRIFAGQPVSQVLALLKISPDLAWEPVKEVDLDYIHYASADGEVDVYYVVNKWSRNGINDQDYRYSPTLPDRFVNVRCTFRVAGDRAIERWDPVRGIITPAYVYEKKNSGYSLPVSLEPEGGAFYVFRKAAVTEHIVRIIRDGNLLSAGNTPLEVMASDVFVRKGAIEAIGNGIYEVVRSDGRTNQIEVTDVPGLLDLSAGWQAEFLERAELGSPFKKTFNTLKSWTESADRNEKYFSGTARYTRSFRMDESPAAKGRRVYLDLGYVGDIATVRVNGKDAGVLWKAPYAVDITDCVQAGENLVQIDVTNLWINRLIGDAGLPADERKTRVYGRNMDAIAKKQLRVSGLLGPVMLRVSHIYDFMR